MESCTITIPCLGVKLGVLTIGAIISGPQKKKIKISLVGWEGKAQQVKCSDQAMLTTRLDYPATRYLWLQVTYHCSEYPAQLPGKPFAN